MTLAADPLVAPAHTPPAPRLVPSPDRDLLAALHAARQDHPVSPVVAIPAYVAGYAFGTAVAGVWRLARCGSGFAAGGRFVLGVAERAILKPPPEAVARTLLGTPRER